jgi:hypothetical protein
VLDQEEVSLKQPGTEAGSSVLRAALVPQLPTLTDKAVTSFPVLLFGNWVDDTRRLSALTISKVASIGLKPLRDGDSHSIEQQYPLFFRFLHDQ